MKRKLPEKVISILLCLNLLVNSFLPLVAYAQNFDPGGGEGGEVPQEPAQVCTEVYRYNECNWDTKQVYEVYQNGCTDEWIRKNYRQEEGQCGYTALSSGTSDYYNDAAPAVTIPTETTQESVSETTGLTPASVSENISIPTATPVPTFAPPVGLDPELLEPVTPAPSATILPSPTEIAVLQTEEVITSPTSQDRAINRYQRRMEEMDDYQDELYANTRADQQGSGADATYTPSKLGNMVRNQADRVEEEINKIAESITPKTREEVLRDQRLAQKEEQLNKLTEQADKEYKQAEKQRKEALQAAMDLKPEQRIAALNAAIGLPQDTDPEKTLMLFNNSAKALGVKVDVKDDGSYTITLENEPSPSPALTYTPYVPGSSFAPASISVSSTIDPKPLCDHIKDPVEKDKCQNEWRTIAVGGTVAVTAAGVAIVSAPVWLPAAGAGLSTAATIINTSTTAMYVYPTVAGGVLLSRSPAIIQQGIGFLAQKSSVVIPTAVWLSCQFQNNPVDCVSRELGMADLPMVLTEGTKAVKAAAKVQGGVEVAAEEAIRLTIRGKNREPLDASKVFIKPQMWREEGFNLSEELAEVKGPMVEIAGPTEKGFDLGFEKIKVDELGRKVYVSNIYQGAPVFVKKGSQAGASLIGFEGKVDFQADATNLPMKDGSLGAVFASCFPDFQMCGGTMESGYRKLALDEAYNKLKEGGLLIWQGGGINQDIEYAEKLGFEIVQTYQRSSDDLPNVVFRKTDELDNALADRKSVWGAPEGVEAECAGLCSIVASAFDRVKDFAGLGEKAAPLPVVDSPKGSGFAAMSDWAKQNFRFLDSSDYRVVLPNGEVFTMADKAINNSGRVIVPLRDAQGKVTMAYLSTSEGDFKWFVGTSPDGWFIKTVGSKARADVAIDIDKGLKHALANGDIEVVNFKKGKDEEAIKVLENFGMTYDSPYEGMKAMENRINLLNAGTGANEIKFRQDYVADIDLQHPTDVVENGLDRIDVYYKGSKCDCRITFNLNPKTLPIITSDEDTTWATLPQKASIDFTFRPNQNPNDIYVGAPALSRTNTAADEAWRLEVDINRAVEAENGWMDYYNRIYLKLMRTPVGQEIARATNNFTKQPTPREVGALMKKIQSAVPQDKSRIVQSLNPNGSWSPVVQAQPRQATVQMPGVSNLPSIDTATSWNALFQVLDQRGGVQGSTSYYSSGELKRIIQDVVTGKKGIDSVTRSDGLRDKVEELMQSGKRSFLQNVWFSLRKIFNVQNVYAAEEATSSAVVADSPDSFDQMMAVEEFQLLATKTDVKNRLLENGQITSEEVKQLLIENSQIPSQGLKNNNRIVVTTGDSGEVEFEVDPGVYRIDSLPIKGVDLTLPATITIEQEDITIGIGLRKGSGQVKLSGNIANSFAAEQKKPKVKVVVYYDQNSNGEFDSGEKVIHWAGVVVSLTKAVQDKSISLNAGWNLVSLTALPAGILTASALLSDINKQGGEITTVSTLVDGAWKSFVARGENDYSIDDFPIEVGKAYFVKALKPSAFKYSGQNLVSPVKLSLKTGWNAVGLPKTAKTYQASSLIDTASKQASGSGTLSWWDFGLWDTFVQRQAQQYGNNFNILPGFGYILKVERETEITP